MSTVTPAQKATKPKMKRLVSFRSIPMPLSVAAVVAVSGTPPQRISSPTAVQAKPQPQSKPQPQPTLQAIVPPPIAAKPVEVVRVKAREEGFGKLPEHGFVRLPQILEVYPISRAGWWAGVKDGTLPAGVLLSPRVRAWAVEDIRRLIAEAKQAA